MQTDATTETGYLAMVFLAFVIGSLIEMRRISSDWGRIWIVLAVAILATLVGLVISLLKGYSLESYAYASPQWFIFALLVASVGFFYSELTTKLGEGNTFLHSGALVYFLAELGKKDPSAYVLLLVCIAPIIFSVVHALTYKELNKTTRLLLCLWSMVVMLIFSCVYLYTIWGFEAEDRSAGASGALGSAYVYVEAFALGAAGPYMMHKALSLWGLFTTINEKASEQKKVTDLFVAQYSTEQVSRSEIGLIAALAGFFWIGNYRNEWVEPSLAIWACFMCMHLVLWGLSYVAQRLKPKV
jgi:hypothetical protein